MTNPILKEAILDVIDNKNAAQWRFYDCEFPNTETAEAEANEQRLDFADAVINRYFHLLRVELAKDGN